MLLFHSNLIISGLQNSVDNDCEIQIHFKCPFQDNPKWEVDVTNVLLIKVIY